jgi:antitoxin MazE9
MKVSVSLPEDDVAFVDEYARRRGAASRSSVLHQAIDLLRVSELETAYEAAWEEWHQTDDAGLWDATAGDGLTDAAR